MGFARGRSFGAQTGSVLITPAGVTAFMTASTCSMRKAAPKVRPRSQGHASQGHLAHGIQGHRLQYMLIYVLCNFKLFHDPFMIS